MSLPTVGHTAEFQRIVSLPRRAWSEADLAFLTTELTSILGIPGARCAPKPGDRTHRAKAGLCLECGQPVALRPVQALALHDAGTKGGVFGAIGVGEGKTLISFLLPLVMGARRPLLLMPATLIEKTQRARIDLAPHWRIPGALRVFSYEMLGLVQSEHELDSYAPDLIILEEGHKAKNKRAARTRRLARYMVHNPTTRVAVLSGTVMDKSLKDFAHLLLWSLKLEAPVPITTEEIEEWAAALDKDVDPYARPRAGALLELCQPEDSEGVPEHVAARRGFRRRLTETPGVVATIGEGEHVDCSIYVKTIRHPVAPVTEANFLKLRGDAKREDLSGWVTPDGWELERAAEVWAIAQQLALGLHYVWDPRPPQEWTDARRAWGKFVRDTISRSRTWDSELHVANAVDAGKLDEPGPSVLAAWRKVRDTFKPNTVPIWHDDSALKVCAAWLKKDPGICWTDHVFFARRLSELTGVPYYGAEGKTDSGDYIEYAKPGSSCIASIDANREGKNLQGLWSRNLVACPPTSAGIWEQLIARTHRPGQFADEVTVEVLLGCRENFDAMTKALEGARVIFDMTGKTQKLLIADVTLPTEAEIDALRSPRWVK